MLLLTILNLPQLMWEMSVLTRQGLYGALEQYWNVEPKVRLHRRNTYFDDVMSDISNEDAFRVGIVVSVMATAIIVFWSLLGVIL